MLQHNFNRWAIVRNGELLSPVYANPYTVTDPETGDILDFPAMTAEQRQAAGFVEVGQRDWREIDETIEQRTSPELVMENGQPVEIHRYQFVPGAVQQMLVRIDEQAEAMRSATMTSHPLQVVEYQEAKDEALRFLALSPEEQATQLEVDWPYLAADIGVTATADSTEEAPAYCQSLLEAATVVKLVYDYCRTRGAEIRQQRLRAKHQISIAPDAASAFEVYKKAWVV